MNDPRAHRLLVALIMAGLYLGIAAVLANAFLPAQPSTLASAALIEIAHQLLSLMMSLLSIVIIVTGAAILIGKPTRPKAKAPAQPAAPLHRPIRGHTLGPHSRTMRSGPATNKRAHPS